MSSSLQNLVENFDLIFRDWRGPFQSVSSTAVNDPCNVYEQDGTLVLQYAIPGRTSDDVEVSVQENVLSIDVQKLNLDDFVDNQKPEQHTSTRKEFIVRRISGSSISHRWKINSTYDLGKVDVSLVSGLLTIKIPTKRDNKRIIIDIADQKSK